MARLRVHSLAMSLDGFVAGPNQAIDDPMGVGGEGLHRWVFETRFGRQMIGGEGGSEGVDNDFLDRGFDGIGAWIMGRNMFGPVRGDWGDSDWRGWWGDNPPYHCDVFVLTHYPHEPIEMDGGTTFHFTDDPIDAVLARAADSAGGLDIRLGGGASTVRQYLAAGLVDEMHVAIAPVLLGAGERLFDGTADYECIELVGGEGAAHARFTPRREG